jgi:hypothetical protein
VATVTVKLGREVTQQVDADDFLVWPNHLRLIEQ